MNEPRIIRLDEVSLDFHVRRICNQADQANSAAEKAISETQQWLAKYEKQNQDYN